MDTNEPEVAN